MTSITNLPSVEVSPHLHPIYRVQFHYFLVTCDPVHFVRDPVRVVTKSTEIQIEMGFYVISLDRRYSLVSFHFPDPWCVDWAMFPLLPIHWAVHFLARCPIWLSLFVSFEISPAPARNSKWDFISHRHKSAVVAVCSPKDRTHTNFLNRFSLRTKCNEKQPFMLNQMQCRMNSITD